MRSYLQAATSLFHRRLLLLTQLMSRKLKRSVGDAGGALLMEPNMDVREFTIEDAGLGR